MWKVLDCMHGQLPGTRNRNGRHGALRDSTRHAGGGRGRFLMGGRGRDLDEDEQITTKEAGGVVGQTN